MLTEDSWVLVSGQSWKEIKVNGGILTFEISDLGTGSARVSWVHHHASNFSEWTVMFHLDFSLIIPV